MCPWCEPNEIALQLETNPRPARRVHVCVVRLGMRAFIRKTAVVSYSTLNPTHLLTFRERTAVSDKRLPRA